MHNDRKTSRFNVSPIKFNYQIPNYSFSCRFVHLSTIKTLPTTRERLPTQALLLTRGTGTRCQHRLTNLAGQPTQDGGSRARLRKPCCLCSTLPIPSTLGFLSGSRRRHLSHGISSGGVGGISGGGVDVHPAQTQELRVKASRVVLQRRTVVG